MARRRFRPRATIDCLPASIFAVGRGAPSASPTGVALCDVCNGDYWADSRPAAFRHPGNDSCPGARTNAGSRGHWGSSPLASICEREERNPACLGAIQGRVAIDFLLLAGIAPPLVEPSAASRNKEQLARGGTAFHRLVRLRGIRQGEVASRRDPQLARTDPVEQARRPNAQ